jgi:hypothetical protein
LRLDTDTRGLLTFNPLAGAPLAIGRDHAASGRGFSIDLGAGAAVGRWAVGVAVTGIANRIDWQDVTRRTYTLSDLYTGSGSFNRSGEQLLGDRRVELPVDYRTAVRYEGEGWSARADFGRGFQGTTFHGGLEQRLGPIDVRLGTSRSREQWHPTGGIGLNITRRVGLDVALFGTSLNAARERRAAVAASLRFTANP